MHISTYKLILTSLYSLAFLAGCASTTPYLDEHFGDSVNAAKAQQTLNPEASLDTEPVNGVDGQAANAAVDRYHRSFVQPPVTPNIFNIGVGSGGSNSGASGNGVTGSGTQ
jgi:hypothetical protein